MRSLLLQITAAIMETPALIDQTRDRATVVLIRSLQAVEPAIVEESLRDDVSTSGRRFLWLLSIIGGRCS